MDDWKEIQIEMLTQPSDKTAKSEPAPESARVESIAEMVTEGSIVATATEGDPNYDCYLLKVISTDTEPELLTENEQHDYETIIAGGCRILIGHFLERENLLDITFRLNDHKTAIIHILTVRCICFDLEILKKKGKQSKGIYKVCLKQHEEIMGNI